MFAYETINGTAMLQVYLLSRCLNLKFEIKNFEQPLQNLVISKRYCPQKFMNVKHVCNQTKKIVCFLDTNTESTIIYKH